MPNVKAPSPKGGHTAFLMHPRDPRIFVFGGADGDRFLSEFYSLNTSTVKWQSAHTYYPPRARAYHSLAIVAPEQKKLARGAVPVVVVYGGFNRGDCLSDLPVLEEWGVLKRGPNPPAKLEVPAHLKATDPPPGLEEDIWGTVLPQGEVPVGRCNHSCAVMNGGRRMVVFGGWNTAFVDHVYVLDTQVWRWALRSTIPSRLGGSPDARASAASCTVSRGRQMLIHGGQDRYGQRDDLWLLDLDTFAWLRVRQKGRVPAARSGHTLTYLPEHELVVMFGGWTANGSMSNEVHIASVVAEPEEEGWRWHQVRVGGDSIKARAGHSATLVGDAIWIIGGVTASGAATDDVFTLQTGFARFTFDYVDPEERRAELAAQQADLEAAEAEEEDEADARTAALSRRVETNRLVAQKQANERKAREMQLKEQELHILTRKVMGEPSPQSPDAARLTARCAVRPGP